MYARSEAANAAQEVTPRVTAIVPTLAERTRREGLLRAIDSLRNAASERLRILVVVNGSRFDPETVSLVRDASDVDVVQIEVGSLPYALEVGRGLVETPYFCFLDDDDEYLPGAIDLRLRALEAEPKADLVVTNGQRYDGEHRFVALKPLDGVSRDPLGSLFEGNWLASCGGLFRSDRVSPEVFTDINAYTEWTWIAFRLALEGRRVAVLDTPTFRINETAGSASKSDAYRRAFLELYRRMLQAALPKEVQRTVRSRISDVWHDLAVIELGRGNRAKAWRCHLASMRSSHGMRYLAFTRRLVTQV
ncbi:glycosyltransferase family 2 protein [Quisquiliibacterium transsilvanicum]|uniref:Glycosyltransferase involved in cell wall biosynthesis n=1 Tax=Quisquiliibacterium transsilvanicum TaxID=1549638 RepID=A0A7W8HDF9_9BURK|nr:glycosyltransferase family A protein [Quisquiliibacterium transsilvanicum]MBB5270034.1 glycosyltransferase involved in cell wall biosynthesis [Quisquiliibacterium transsilvanicum]